MKIRASPGHLGYNQSPSPSSKFSGILGRAVESPEFTLMNHKQSSFQIRLVDKYKKYHWKLVMMTDLFV